MTQISKRYIEPRNLNKILNIFLSSVLKIENKKSAKNFFKELLTPTEEIMLSKRIVCFYLLSKNSSIIDCANILKLSTATVAKYKILLNDRPTVDMILKKVLKIESIKKLFNTIFHEYISPPFKYGTDWSAGVKIYNEYKKRKESPI